MTCSQESWGRAYVIEAIFFFVEISHFFFFPPCFKKCQKNKNKYENLEIKQGAKTSLLKIKETPAEKIN